jgi:hypothetical protein
MTTQPRLWGHADTRSVQRSLFDQGGRVSELSCCSCSAPLEHTPGGYLACPNGCGRLLEAQTDAGPPDERGSGLWFGDDLTGSE